MGRTATYKLPWPEFSNRPLAPIDIQRLAEATEAALKLPPDEFVKAGGGVYTVNSAGLIRIPASACFFSGKAPSVIEFSPEWPGDIISFSKSDSTGVFATVFDAPNGTMTSAGVAVTTMWSAFK